MVHVKSSPAADSLGDHRVRVAEGSRSQHHMVDHDCTSLRVPCDRPLASVHCLRLGIALSGEVGRCRERGDRFLGCRVAIGDHLESATIGGGSVSERPLLGLEIV